MAEDKFKLPLSSYEELAKIIKGYGHMTAPASLDQMSKLTGLNSTIISANAGFLVAIAVLEPGAKKVVTEQGRQLARALEHEMPPEIEKHWRITIDNNEFLTRLVTSIRIRRGMTEDTLTSHIAYSADQPKRARFMTGARTIIDILRAGGVIEEADGKIVPTTRGGITSQSASTESSGPTEETARVHVGGLSGPPSLELGRATAGEGSVTVSIRLNVNCTPDDLEDVGKRIRSVIDDITRSSTDAPSS